MADKNGKLRFEASANLQKLLGEELVTNEEMAVIELIKNAYDSGATKVGIVIQPATTREPGFIEITDNGSGMDLTEFQRIFMFAGYSERDTQATTSPRVPTGEKGIGRFAADKLGSKLELLTKKKGATSALRVNIDWNAFRNKKKKFSDIQVPYERVEQSRLTSQESGTVLTIRNLRAVWTRSRTESVRGALAGLLNPFARSDGFEIELQVPRATALSGAVKQLPPEDADYDLRVRVSDDGKFLLRRLKSPAGKDSEWSPVPTDAEIGNLKGLACRFLYYVKRPSKKLSKGTSPGVQIYRDGFRLQPFGSPLERWLQLTERRAKRAGHAPLVPSRLFGFVEVSRLLQPGIKDITSRQGLMETDDFHQMITVLREQTAFLEEQIRQQVSIPSWKEGGKERSIEIERSRVQTLGDLSIGIAHEIRQPLQSILSEAGAIEERLKELQIGDGELRESLETIDDGIRRIDETIQLIQDFAKGDLEAVDSFDVVDIIRRTCRLFSTEAKSKGIRMEFQLPAAQQVRTNKNTIERVLANLVKNAIEAIQERRDFGEGLVTVSLERDERTTSLVVTDNGGGIAKEVIPKLFKTFATKKTGGLGYGLSHSRTIIRAHGGDITFETTAGEGSRFVVTLPDVGG